jgi:2-C-methyl-D-erythritol 4-phosphate cytidylyltransferase
VTRAPAEARAERAKVCGILLAGGSSTRFGALKQFERVEGSTLIELALRTTVACCDHTTLVLPADVASSAVELEVADAVVVGGSSRSESVQLALQAVPDTAEIVVVHQAANPLASRALFSSVIQAVRAGAVAAVPGLPLIDVVRRVDRGRLVEDVGRDDLVTVQTPGAFRAEVLREAHASGRPAIEDTELVGGCGYPIDVVAGDPFNIHVTTLADLRLVRAILLSQGVDDVAGDRRESTGR